MILIKLFSQKRDSCFIYFLLKIEDYLWHMCFYKDSLQNWRKKKKRDTEQGRNCESPDCEHCNLYIFKMQLRTTEYLLRLIFKGSKGHERGGGRLFRFTREHEKGSKKLISCVECSKILDNSFGSPPSPHPTRVFFVECVLE